MATAPTIVNTVCLVLCLSIPCYAVACRFAELTSGQNSYGEPSSAGSSASSESLILRVVVCRSSLGLSLECVAHVSGVFMTNSLLLRAMTCN